jgi:ornithine cyclodeaminase/alanine dehydrogenase-like protein (mu-crystallin family)
MESELITKLRTAAGTAVALDQLARADGRRLLVCGTGAQALPHIEAVAAIRDLESVQLWGRSPERAQATPAQLRERFPDLQSAIAHDVSAAARLADLIVCLTSAAKPYLHTGDVRPGTTIAAVGSETPEKHELSTELLASATLVCDVTHHCAHAGELHHALEAAVITLAGVRSEIGDVIAARATADGPKTRS